MKCCALHTLSPVVQAAEVEEAQRRKREREESSIQCGSLIFLHSLLKDDGTREDDARGTLYVYLSEYAIEFNCTDRFSRFTVNFFALHPLSDSSSTSSTHLVKRYVFNIPCKIECTRQ